MNFSSRLLIKPTCVTSCRLTLQRVAELLIEGGNVYTPARDHLTHAKPSVREEEHFARHEAELLRKLTEERRAKLLAEELERERKLHFMKCPKCGMQLEEIAFGDVHR
jgi:hypothetical protein